MSENVINELLDHLDKELEMLDEIVNLTNEKTEYLSTPEEVVREDGQNPQLALDRMESGLAKTLRSKVDRLIRIREKLTDQYNRLEI